VILDEILAHKRAEVAERRATVGVERLRKLPGYAGARREFRQALAGASDIAVVAEIKRASPSRGVIREAFDPPAHARAYEQAGATCLSVLTDERFFQGSLGDLVAARAAVSLPCLRKDFVIDPYQIDEARAFGADCVLVIVAACSPVLGRTLLAAAAAAGLDVLTEVHDEAELEWALAAGASLIGVNNRDLRTFETSLATTERLAKRTPPGVLLVAESGIRSNADVRRMQAAGARAVLVGEALMAEPDPGAALRELRGCR